MKTSELKNIIKEAVKEVFQEEMKDILLEAVRGNKQSINESEMKTINFNSNSLPHRSNPNITNAKQEYMNILGDIAKGPKSGFDGEFKANSNVDTINGALPEGQLGIDQIMNLIHK